MCVYEIKKIVAVVVPSFGAGVLCAMFLPPFLLVGIGAFGCVAVGTVWIII